MELSLLGMAVALNAHDYDVGNPEPLQGRDEIRDRVRELGPLVLDVALGVYITFLYSTPSVALVPISSV